MSMKIRFNPTQLEVSIRNLAEKASANAARGMRRAAVRIRDLARAYAPRDTGALEAAIDYSTTTDANRRKVFVVHIDVGALHPDGDKQVGDYAWIMEQQLHPHGRRAPGAPDYHTRAKSGPKVGGRFLSRAVKDGTKTLLQDARAEVSRTLGGARLVNTNYQRDTGAEE